MGKRKHRSEAEVIFPGTYLSKGTESRLLSIKDNQLLLSHVSSLF